MAEIVNLRTARKRKARADKEQHAAENRVRFGKPKGEKRLESARAALERARHDAGRIEKPDE
jgi:hypothetical protein